MNTVRAAAVAAALTVSRETDSDFRGRDTGVEHLLDAAARWASLSRPCDRW